MIKREGDRVLVEGPMTLDTVPALAADVEPHFGDGAHVLDLQGVTEVDSSAVALLLEWRRTAESRRLALRFANIPSSVENLARLYGVSDLLHAVAD